MKWISGLLLLMLGSALFAQSVLPSVPEGIVIPEDAARVQQELEQQQQAENEAAQRQLLNNRAAQQSSAPSKLSRTVSLENHLKGKLVGRRISYYDESVPFMQQGIVRRVEKDGESFSIVVYNRNMKREHTCTVRFVQDFKSKLQQDSRFTSDRDNRAGQSMAFDSDLFMSGMVKKMAGEEDSTAPSMAFPERTESRFNDVVKNEAHEGVVVPIINPSTKDTKKGKVVVYKGRMYMLDGMPLQLLFEKE